MKIDGKLFIVFIMALVLIPGACAISIGGGVSISGTGSAQGNSVTTPVTNGAQTTGFSVASGAMKDIETHWLKDSTGKYAEVDVNVPSATSLTYRYSLSPSNSYDQKTIPTSQSSLAAQEWLTVTNAATTIQANANAQNGEGDKANVGINMGPGSLTGYQNTATATVTQATASQSATSASSTQIKFNSLANNKELDSAWSSLTIGQGSVTGYSSSATGTKTQATASQSATSVTGNQINFNSWASNLELDNASPTLQVTTGSVTGYSSSATGTKTQATASQSATSASVASGKQIVYQSSAWNKELDDAWTTAEVYGGSINGFASSATTTSTSAIAKQSATSASGPVIWFLEQAQNNEKDTVGVQAAGSIYPNVGAIIQNGQITSYSGSATSTKTSATKNVNIAKLSGSSINFGPYAWNNEKDSATSILTSTTGSIGGYYDSASTTSTTATAYQQMNSITSSGAATIQGSSNNAANDYATASIYASSGTITSPTSNTYASKTSVYAYPTVSQISTPGNGNIYAYASNPLGEISNFNLGVTNGVITNPNFYAWSQPTITEAKLVSLTNAYGATATITSHAQNLALARDPNSGSIKYGGSADFEALNTNGNKFTNPTVDTTATGSLVTIASTGFPKTALLLGLLRRLVSEIYMPQ